MIVVAAGRRVENRGEEVGICVTLASQKGGVGKTTSAVNLAASLAVSGQRVLLVDFDPQGNASSGVGQADHDATGFLSGAAAGEDLTRFVAPTFLDNLFVVCSCSDLSRLDLIQRVQQDELPRFRAGLRALAERFDYVLFDCPPSLGGLPTIALSCSEKVLVPVQCEYYAMEGLSQILPIIKELKKQTNRDLAVGGLLLTMFCESLELSHEVQREVREYFGAEVFTSVIPRDVILAEAASHGLPAFHYAPLSRGAWSYLELAKEVREHGWS